MTDTAQPGLAAENVAIDQAADAFKSFLTPQPERPRDEQGRFAPQPRETEEEEDQEIEADAQAPVANDEEPDATEPDAETEDTAQPEPSALPSSWSAEDKDLWESLPPEAQAKIVEREGQMTQGFNRRFQEAANARKQAEAALAEANANRDRHKDAIDYVLSLVQPQEPDPYQYGLGTTDYNRDAYDAAMFNYRQQMGVIQSLAQQREQIAQEQAREMEARAQQQRDEIEQQAWPKLIADVPDLQDQSKAPAVLNEIMSYAISQGIPEQVFKDPAMAKGLTSVEFHMAWKAMMYDRQREAARKVKAGNPPPKPAAPSVRPGVQPTRSSIEHANLSKARERLAKSGSVEDAAVLFKSAFKGR